MSVASRFGRHARRSCSLTALGSAALALVGLSLTGCGLAAGLLVGVISDAIDGSDSSKSTKLLVANDATSTEAIVTIEAARFDDAHAPYTYAVNTTPGTAASLKNVFDAGPHWVRVVFASGWRSRPLSVTIVKDDTVTLKFVRPPTDLAPMAGTWFGGADSSAGVPHTYALTLDAAGAASARALDGVPSAATGTLAETSEGCYRVTWSDATVCALVTDGAHAHAGLVADDGLVGALQRGAAAPLPTGADADVVGSWNGTEIRLVGAPVAPAGLDAATANVTAQQHWSSTAGFGVGSTGVTPLVVTAAPYLRFEADAESNDPVPTAQSLGMWLTADKAFAFTVRAPAAGGAFPDTGIFQILSKVQ